MCWKKTWTLAESCANSQIEDYFNLVSHTLSDGSALWHHGFQPSLHPLYSPPCPWCITLWLLNYHVTFLPPIALLEEKRNLVCAVWKGTRLGKDACWPVRSRFPNLVLTWGCFKFFFVQGSLLNIIFVRRFGIITLQSSQPPAIMPLPIILSRVQWRDFSPLHRWRLFQSLCGKTLRTVGT
jgi:hypothetical protein